jgi:hypothetical protein
MKPSVKNKYIFVSTIDKQSPKNRNNIDSIIESYTIYFVYSLLYRLLYSYNNIKCLQNPTTNNKM